MSSLRKTLTRRVSKPLRVLKALSPKSKSKGHGTGSQSSGSDTASVSSSAPPAEATISKLVVVQAQIGEDAQKPVQAADREKLHEEHEAERRPTHDLPDSAPISQTAPSAATPEPEETSFTSEPALHVDTKPSVVASEDTPPSHSEVALTAPSDATPENVHAIAATEDAPGVTLSPLIDVVDKEELPAQAVDVVDVVEEDRSHVTQPLAESEFIVVSKPSRDDNDDDNDGRASLPPPVTVVELFDEPSKDMDAHVSQPSPSPLDSEAKAVDPVEDMNPFIDDEPLAVSAETVASNEEKLSSSLPQSLPEKSLQVSKAVSSHPLSEHSNAPLNVNKEVPPFPSSPSPSASASSSESEPEEPAPVAHAPGLILPTLFLPIPNTDPLTTLLIKHVPDPHMRPPRDISGDWQQSDFHTLVMTNNWRALARMARDRIVKAAPSDVEMILELWYLRLSSLARLRLFNQVSAECDNLFVALSSIEPPAAQTYVFNDILPFELEVLQARCTYWAGDPLGYLDDMSILHRRCKLKARSATNFTDAELWKERGARMCLIMASQLAEMNDFTAAANLLEPLYKSSQSPVFLSAIARIYLQAGDLSSAGRLFEKAAAHPDADESLRTANSAMLSVAYGDWKTSSALYEELMSKDQGDIVAINNYAVCLLGQGRIKEGIHVMESALQASPSAVTTTEPFLFNLSTLYELHSGLTASKKRELLIEVAKWSGDGVRTACLKLPAA